MEEKELEEKVKYLELKVEALEALINLLNSKFNIILKSHEKGEKILDSDSLTLYENGHFTIQS